MAAADSSDPAAALLQPSVDRDSSVAVQKYDSLTKMSAYLVGILVPLLFSYVLSNRKKGKVRGVPVDAAGDDGMVMRCYQFPSPIEMPFEGASTLADLFEQSCKKHAHVQLLGTRKLISREMDVSPDGRSLEKLHLGNYEWLTYAHAFERACNFASGLTELGHERGERAAIFAETRAEWLIALHGCFRRNITVVTIYASLGDEALAHSLNETEVSTVICDQKQLKKLIDISTQLDTVKHVVYMEDEGITSEPYLSGRSSGWTVLSLSRVESLGRERPIDADLPVAADVAVIMYTSGSTGMPK
ncbi:hypothetical protein KI387_016755, partial [Taxus chinensis]